MTNFPNFTPKSTRNRRGSFRHISAKNKVFRPGEGKEKARNIKKFFRNIFVLSLIITGIYYFLFSKTFLIENIEFEIEGDLDIQSEIIIDELEQYRYKNIFLTDASEIEDTIAPYLKNSAFFDVKKSIPHTLKITVLKYKELINLSINIDGIEKKYIVNQNGQISRENIDDETLPYINMISRQESDEGNFRLNPEEMNYMINAKNYFEEKLNIQVDHIDYYQIEHEVHLITKKDFAVWLDIDQEYLIQIHALKVAISTLDIFNTALEYIDLRVSNGQKVIYKKK